MESCARDRRRRGAALCRSRSNNTRNSYSDLGGVHGMANARARREEAVGVGGVASIQSEHIKDNFKRVPSGKRDVRIGTRQRCRQLIAG
ncbi:unnamed protein product [Amoebophrya sp. A25]|nr:unnamed protein product [Amoebophrya sp. A25]|eukprot:GSA25T00000284001.1